MNHSVSTTEQATSVTTPAVAESGVAFVVGAAPVQSAANPAKVGIPVICTSWQEAVEKLGYSDNWTKYGLCEFMYSHFKLFCCQPVIFCNILDASKTEAVAAADMDVVDHKVKLPIEAVVTTVVVKANDKACAAGTDYGTYVDGEYLVIELLADGSAYAAKSLNVAYSKVNHEVAPADVAAGIEAVELCLTTLGIVPDLICAPGWSHNSTVAAAMVAKAATINGLFKAKAVTDLDCTATGAKSYTEAIALKASANMTDKDQIVCWPMLRNGDHLFHKSTQTAGLLAQVDTKNGGVPYESPSNKNLKCDGLALADGTEVNLTLAQANQLNAAGITTALNFVNGWVEWGNYTGCYPASTDVKDYMIPISRMFGWVGNTLIKTFWSKLDQPMTRRLIDNILDTANIWLNGLVGQGYLLGARVEMNEDENPLSNLMAGYIKLHVYLTPPGPAQEIDFVLEYDASYATAALQG